MGIFIKDMDFKESVKLILMIVNIGINKYICIYIIQFEEEKNS